MIGILLSLVPLISWGISDYIASRYSKKLHLATINIFYAFGGTVTAFIVSLFLGFPEITMVGFMLYMFISIILTSGFLSMVKAFSVGATGVVSPIANSYAILTAIIAVIFLNAELKVTGAIAIVVIVLGMTLLTYKKDPNHNKKDFEKSVRYSLLALVLFGVGFALFDVAAAQEWYQDSMLYQITGALVSIMLYIWMVKKHRLNTLKVAAKSPLLCFGAIIGGVGAVGLFAAFIHVDNVAIPAAVAAASPLMTAFLAYKFDKEHLTILQRFASIVIVSGIVLLAI